MQFSQALIKYSDWYWVKTSVLKAYPYHILLRSGGAAAGDGHAKDSRGKVSA